jgi:thiamine pyrophosphate-dependent acetolactate synthase large subunit-like protein
MAGFRFVAMSDNRVSDVLAQAFAAEGVDTLFTLMGDANMYWSASMADNQKVRLIHARHEHCCVAMADAYARATGKVGVGSVTCGPGYTQIMTALAMAARGNAPVVVFAGDAPIGASWYIQSIDQAPLALATGAHFVPIRTIDRALDCVREAFYVARAERKPVVLSVPLDLQKEEFGRVRMAEQPGGELGEKIDILVAVEVPQARALPAHDRQRKRLDKDRRARVAARHHGAGLLILRQAFGITCAVLLARLGQGGGEAAVGRNGGLAHSHPV